MKQIDISKNDAGQRLDKFLMKTFPKMPKSMMYKGIRNKKIKVNRRRCTFDQKLQEGDSVLLFLPPDVLETKQRTLLKNDQLDIVYEDQNLLIINKPAGLLSQSAAAGQDCAAARVQSYLARSGQWDPQEHSFAPAICNRLDRNTEGLVIAAKNAEALRTINRAIARRQIRKFYRARVSGEPDEGNIELYLKKAGTKAIVRKTPAAGYKPAKMRLTVTETNGSTSWCEIELLTGRFHQIRACLAYLGHPLVGDRKYGYRGHESAYHLTAFRLDFSQAPVEIDQKVITLS